MYKIKQFFRNIKNLIRWFPIIWKDRDWDDHFIFEILKFKLQNQAKYIGERGYHTQAKRDAEIMMTCVRLIDKVQTEYYGLEYFDYHNSELIFTDSEDYPGHYKMSVMEKSEHYDDYFKKYPRIAKQFTIEDKGKKAFKISRINEQRAHKLLFKILEENITRWWD
jgi:hypothetical protein